MKQAIYLLNLFCASDQRACKFDYAAC